MKFICGLSTGLEKFMFESVGTQTSAQVTYEFLHLSESRTVLIIDYYQLYGIISLVSMYGICINSIIIFCRFTA